MFLFIVLLALLVLASLWTIMTSTLLFSAIGLALTSVVLTILIFSMGSSLAAVFELSVCAGLISVLFISAISLTEAASPKRLLELAKEKAARYRLLPLAIIVLAALAYFVRPEFDAIKVSMASGIDDARLILWGNRQLDILGQIIILICGVFGVLILFKEGHKK